MKRKSKAIRIKWYILTLIFIFSNLYINRVVFASEPNKKAINETLIKAEIERIYNTRSSAFVSGNLLSIKPLFDTSQNQGLWSLEHEIKRIKYLNDWANQRSITFGNVESYVRIKKISHQGGIVKIALEESYKFDYVYNNDEASPINSFGIGIRHTLSLINKNGKWLVYTDWYTDCFQDALQPYDANIPSTNLAHSNNQNTEKVISTINALSATETRYSFKKYYDRQKMVAYADKYCGAAWGSGNNFKYNKHYNDYNGLGGDCTNFASQCLTDKEGGGLPRSGTWVPHSRAWVNADGLEDHLINSGKGSIISTGTFKELTTPKSNSQPLISRIQLGDLICYEKGRGNIDHFAIVTGFDCHGYPLVNSHTTDRYHVPWDLGWGDKDIRFMLIHING